MKSDIRALILDFGGVISRTLFETHRESELALGLTAGTLTWRGPFADKGEDLLWEAMQRDEISEREYWLTRTREVGCLLGESWTQMQTLVQRTRSDVASVIRPEAIDAINHTKAAGLHLAILSNELDLFYGVNLRARLPLLDRFDCIVDATYSKILKPDPRAYLMCCEQIGYAPNQCLFVDDQWRNVKGALNAGMSVLHFDVTAPQVAYQQVLQQLSSGQ